MIFDYNTLGLHRGLNKPPAGGPVVGQKRGAALVDLFWGYKVRRISESGA